MPILVLLLTGCGPSSPPNILLFTLDTTRADSIGAYGNTAVQTPNIDRLAREGARFDRAYTVTPLTIPAHSSMMTGMWPPRHGVRDNGDYFLGDEAHTLAELLKENGYATMASVGAEVTSHHWGFAQGFDSFYDDMGQQDDTKGNRWRVERSADRVVADARGWLDGRAEADGKKPWFAWVHVFDAHHPYEPPEPFATLYPAQPYLGEISYVDTQIGALLDSLRARGELDNTWVIVVADHGEGLGSHGEAMHGVLLYDATTRIPMIVRPPGGRAARTVATPTSLVDLMPTILAAARVAVPAGLDGLDLTPLVAGSAEGDATRAVYAESLYGFHHYGWAPQKSLVTLDRKLIDSTTPEVYAKGDKDEKSDLAKTDPALLAALDAQLAALEAAMAPNTGAAERVALSAERTAQLEALGYMTGSADAPEDATGLPDPVARLPSLRRLEAARQAVRSGDLEAALLAATEVVAAEPGLVEAQMLLATVTWRKGDSAGAFALAAAVDAAHPGSQPKAMMGAIKLQMGEPEEAARLLGEALALDAYLENAWLTYLRALLILGDQPRLAGEAARGHSLLPDSTAIGGIQGVALAMRGSFGPAESLLGASLAQDPSQPFLSHALGLCLRARGALTQAETLLGEEVRLFPPAIASRRALVEMYADQKRYDEQLAQLNAIAAVEPVNPLTLHSTAQALFNLGRYAESAALIEECVAVAPGYAGCVLLEANVLKKLGKDAEAQAAYERALRLAQPR